MWPVAVFLLLFICICCKRLWSTVATSIASHFSSRLRSAVCSLSTKWPDELWKARVTSGDQFVVHLSLPWFIYGLFLVSGIATWAAPGLSLGSSTAPVEWLKKRKGMERVWVISSSYPRYIWLRTTASYWDANVAVHSLNVEGTFGTEWSHGSWVLEHVSCRNGIVLKQWDKICQMFISLSKKHSSKTL